MKNAAAKITAKTGTTIKTEGMDTDQLQSLYRGLRALNLDARSIERGDWAMQEARRVHTIRQAMMPAETLTGRGGWANDRQRALIANA